MHLVLGVVEPVGTLCTVRVRTLLECVSTDGEAYPDDRVAGLEQVAAPVLRRCGRQPRLHEVVDEGIVSPFGDLMAERVDVLQRPVGPPVRPGKDPRRNIRAPRE